MSRIVLASDDHEIEAKIRRAFGSSLNGELRRWAENLEVTDPVTVVEHLLRGGTELVAFGSDVPQETALHLARTLDRERPEITVVLMTRPTAKLWEQAMKAGVEAVIPLEADDDEIREELSRLLEATARRRDHLAGDGDTHRGSQRIITITSPKGGAGKSVVATNLAVGLAMAAPGEVALVDLDLQFGDVAAGLQLLPEHTIVDAARTPDLDLTSIKVYLTAHPGHLYALCAPTSPAEADEVAPELASRMIRMLAEEFRYVVVDTSGGIDEHALAAIEAASDIVMVGNMDVASVGALRKEVVVLEQLGLVQQVRHFVLNRADSRVGLSAADVEATVGMRVDVAIPSSRSVPIAFNQGVSILESEPRSPVAEQLLALVERFAEVPAAARPSRGGRFSRRRNT